MGRNGQAVDPLFLLLTKPEFGLDGQHSALQFPVNILEHPQCRADYTLSSHQAIEPLIPLLDSPVQQCNNYQPSFYLICF
ncbi:hypothetical protein Hanom_Chr14g01300841 [Helianthus anomalus]